MLIDNNVLLDLGLDRKPDSLIAEELLNRIGQSSTTAFVAWHSVATCYYIIQRDISRATARAFVEQLSGLLTIASVTHQSLLYALSLPMTDFEDAMQVAAARAAGAQHIVTRDEHDFTNSPIPAITPEQALRELF